MHKCWSIYNSNAEYLSQGLQGPEVCDEARRYAQQWANDLGESVFLGPDGSDWDELEEYGWAAEPAGCTLATQKAAMEGYRKDRERVLFPFRVRTSDGCGGAPSTISKHRGLARAQEACDRAYRQFVAANPCNSFTRYLNDFYVVEWDDQEKRWRRVREEA